MLVQEDKDLTFAQKQAISSHSRGVAQPGSALAWGARGRKFESCHPDHASQKLLLVRRELFEIRDLLSSTH